jgi:hypothetical protein
LLAGDNDAYLAVAMIVLRRNNKVVNEDALLDAPAGAAISFDFEVMREEAEEDGPPGRTGGDAGSGRAELEKWWRIWESYLGPSGAVPESYWSPRLAEVVSSPSS